MRNLKLIFASVCTLLYVKSLSQQITNRSGIPAQRKDGMIPVEVWVSTADQSRQLKREHNIFLRSGKFRKAYYSINIQKQKNQRWIGSGVCTNDASSWLMYKKLPPLRRKDLMRRLFSKSSGIGLDWVRHQMGSGDAAVIKAGWWTYDDMPKGQIDTGLKNFSVDMEMDYILPTLKDALAINPQLKIIGCPWTPPGWMKTSAGDPDPLTHGTIKPEFYGAFANYFVKFIKAYAASGVRVDGISLQNEPLAPKQQWQACGIPATTAIEIIKKYLVPQFKSNRINTKIYIYDHNWEEGIKYVSQLYADTQVYAAVSGSMWHHYIGEPAAMTAIHQRYPEKEIWFTEGCATTFPINKIYMDFNSYRGSFLNFAYNVINVPRNWSQTMMMYQIALDPDHGPAVFKPATNYGMVTINPKNGKIDYRPEYFTLGHLSKFVYPGAYRLVSNQYDGAVEDVAFQNPDGSIVVIITNRTHKAVLVKIRYNRKTVNYLTPAESMVTLKWSAKP